MFFKERQEFKSPYYFRTFESSQFSQLNFDISGQVSKSRDDYSSSLVVEQGEGRSRNRIIFSSAGKILWLGTFKMVDFEQDVSVKWPQKVISRIEGALKIVEIDIKLCV